MRSATTVLPAAPFCPSWCTEHPETEAGWDEAQGQDRDYAYKMSAATVGAAQTEDGPVELRVWLFAPVERGELTVERVDIRIDDTCLTPAQAAALVEALQAARDVAALEEIAN